MPDPRDKLLPVGPTGHHVFKSLKAWGAFLIQSTTDGMLCLDVKVQGVTLTHAQKELLKPGVPAGLSGKQSSWGMPRTLGLSLDD